MANLPAPQADDLGPGAVLAGTASMVIIQGAMALPAPPDVISPDYNVQVPPFSISFG